MEKSGASVERESVLAYKSGSAPNNIRLLKNQNLDSGLSQKQRTGQSTWACADDYGIVLAGLDHGRLP